jgi:hypothetical protein
MKYIKAKEAPIICCAAGDGLYLLERVLLFNSNKKEYEV